MNGMDYYLDEAGVGDFVLITVGDNATGNAEPILEKAECVKSYKIEHCIFGSQNSVKQIDGTGDKIKNVAVL